MGKTRAVLAFALLCALMITAVPVYSKKGGPDPPPPPETLIWEATLVAHCSPTVSSPALDMGREYRIVVQGAFASVNLGSGIYDFAADAKYYSPDVTGPLDWWEWTGSVLPAPCGSFLRINGMTVDWGPFSNGYSDGYGYLLGHEYTITYVGEGAPITFRIVDCIDDDCTNNWSHMDIKIYEGSLVALGKTAYAYGGEYATCFRCMDFDGDGKGDFRQWGWSNGPLGPGHYEFDIWAGAAKCDLSKGDLVGTLIVDYDDETTATVTYMMDEGWTMGFAHLYVDGEILPRDGKGDFTVSPGQYPYIEYVDGPTHTFTVSGLSGDIYVVAHAGVFEV